MFEDVDYVVYFIRLWFKFVCAGPVIFPIDTGSNSIQGNNKMKFSKLSSPPTPSCDCPGEMTHTHTVFPEAAW